MKLCKSLLLSRPTWTCTCITELGSLDSTDDNELRTVELTLAQRMPLPEAQEEADTFGLFGIHRNKVHARQRMVCTC